MQSKFEDTLRAIGKKRNQNSPGLQVQFNRSLEKDPLRKHITSISKELSNHTTDNFVIQKQNESIQQNEKISKSIQKVTFFTNPLKKSYEVRNRVLIEKKQIIPLRKETRKDTSQIKNKYFHPELDFLFTEKNIFGEEIPYHLDGNERMYEPQNLYKREKLKKDQDVIDSIYNFMQVFKFDKEDLLQKHFYITEFLQILLILRKDLRDPNKFYDIKNLIKKEWSRENSEDDKLTKEQLFNSLFELVDIWTPDADKEQYMVFFELLKMKILMQNQDEELINIQQFIDVYDII